MHYNAPGLTGQVSGPSEAEESGPRDNRGSEDGLEEIAAPAPQVEVQHYLIDYTLDGSVLRFFLQQDVSFYNSLALMITSFGSEGRMLAAMPTVAKSNLPTDVYKRISAGEVGLVEEVDIPVEATSIRLGVQDQMSNHLGIVDVPLPVPPDPNAPRIAKNKLPEIEPD